MRSPRTYLAVLASLLVLGAAGSAVRGQTRDSLVIRALDATILVLPDGAIEVTELLRPHFYGSWNGVFRNLALEHRTAQGRRERLRVDLVSITDGEGSELRYETERPDSWTRRWRIYVPNALDAERTVMIRYRVDNALRFFEEESDTGLLDELYWNVTGNAWEVPIQRASVSLLLPEGVEPTQSAIYTGPLGATGKDATLALEGPLVRSETTRRLQPGEGLTVAVGWPPGAVPRPGRLEGLVRQLARFWPLAFPVGAFLFCLSAWRCFGKDPEARAIAVQYEPPEGLSPAEVGTLVDHDAQIHDITSTLVDLAVRGYLLVEEQEEKKLLGLLTDKEYVFHFRRSPSDWGELAYHEQRFLQALHRHVKMTVPGAGGSFLGGLAGALGLVGGENEALRSGREEGPPLHGTVALFDLENSFYKSLPGIVDAVYQQLIAKGHYRKSPKRVKSTWNAVGLAAFVLSAGGAIWVAEHGVAFADPMILGAAGLATGLLILVFGQVMPARTIPGARAREHALGFREFLDRVESDRYWRMITGPDLFERYLPFAMAFKVEGRWAKAFQDMFTEPPDWYRGAHRSGRFDTRSFANGMSKLTNAAGSSMSSSPSSSGSGGGGSSGGGSGGGGGGGF